MKMTLDFLWQFLGKIAIAVCIMLGFSVMVNMTVMTAMAQEVVNSDAEFIKSVYETIKAFGGFDFVTKVSACIMILISSMKVSFLRPLWTKLGNGQIWLTMGLGFVAGLCDAFVGQDKFSWSIVAAYTFAGAGAPVLHLILESIKSIPGLGDVYKSVITIIMEMLGGAKIKAQEEAAKKAAILTTSKVV